MTWTATAFAVLVAGCSGATTGATRATTTTTTTASGHVGAPVRAVGCTGHPPSGSTTLQLEVAGHSRLVRVHVPTGYRGTTPVPLVLNLHGSGSTAVGQEAFSGMDATADQDGFLVAYPQGLLPSGSGYDWNVPGQPLVGGGQVPAGAANDVTFLTDLVPALAGRYCIDADRVFATGMSGGGRMASQLGCDAPATFAAVAPVAGIRFPSPCPGTRPVPLIAFHGTADPVDPYDGNGQAYWTYSVPVAAQRWAVHDGCGASAARTSGSGFTLDTYGGCTAGSTVELYSLTGEGHEWPGGPTMARRITDLLGPQSDAVEANATMWAFFAAHPLSTSSSAP